MADNLSYPDSSTPTLPALLGESPAFRATLSSVSALAPVVRPVIVLGERGTGKELIAARLHYLSRRWEQPFLRINCAALNESLLDAELFGHEAGAFTGATRRRAGRFEAADGGSLFLDEIATASMPVQEKILRVVEYGSFERLGSSVPQTADVRLICATNADLPAMVEEGTFRADLLDRLSFAVVTLPPLRQRREDILLLAEHFAVAMTRELERPLFPGFSQTAQELLLDHSWPGNVRELKNVVERAVALAEDPTEPLADLHLDPFARPWPLTESEEKGPFPTEKTKGTTPPLPPSVEPAVLPLPKDFDATVAEYERQTLRRALETHRFNQTEAARALGLGYHRFRRLLQKHDLVGS